MPHDPALVAKLKAFLAELPPATRTSLIRNVDKARLQGRHDPVGALVLEAARQHAWETGEPLPRVASAMRRFFTPLEPFLIGEITARKQPGRISRASLTPIWTFVVRDLVPGRMRDLTQSVLNAALRDDEAQAEALMAEIKAAVLPALDGLLADVRANADRHRRVSGILGGERILEDLDDAARILALGSEIEALLARAPASIAGLNAGDGAALVSLLEDFARGRDRDPGARLGPDQIRERFLYGLAALQPRFAEPLHILALAVAGAGTDDPAQLERSDYGAAVDLALAEIDRCVQRLAQALSARADPARMLKRYHAMVRSFTTALDMNAPSSCQRRLTELRAQASDLVAAEIEPAPQLIRRALNAVDPSTQRALLFDQAEAERAVFAARLFTAARHGSDALGINALLARQKAPIERAFEVASQQLPVLARNGDAALRQEAARRMPYAVEAATALFGEDYAAILKRGFAAAAQDLAAAS